MTSAIPSKRAPSTARRKVGWLMGGLLLLAALGGGGLLMSQRPSADALTTTTTTAVAVERGQVRVSVNGPGTLTAPNSMTVSTTQGGTVGTLPDVGDHVSRGQLITTLTNDTVQNTLQTARLNLQKAQASLDATRTGNVTTAANRQSSLTQALATLEQAQQAYADAQRSLEAQQQLLAVGAAAQADVQAAQSTFNKAQSSLNTAQASVQSTRLLLQTGTESDTQSVRNAQIAVEQAQLSLKMAEQAVSQLKVYAPISGVISSVSVTPGTNVNLNSSATLLTILDDQTMYLPVQIDETEISGVKTGQEAEVSLEAVEGKTFPGVVVTVSPSGTQSSGISVFTATVKLSNPDGLLRSGMTAEAEIIQSQESGLIVPARAIEAVRTRSYVQVTDVDAQGNPVGEPERVRVRTGATDGTNTVVTDGLEAGQSVIVTGRRASSTSGSSSRNNGMNQGGPPPGGFGGPP